MKIDTSAIRKVITHDNCADGLASAIVCRAAMPGVEVEFCQYGTSHWRELAPEPGVLFVDFSPPRETAQAWADAGAYVLDHHEHAKDVVELFGERGLFDNERCGALLAFEEVYAPEKRSGLYESGVHESAAARTEWNMLLHLATLADVRDRWQRNNALWDEANAMNRALMAVHRDVWMESGTIPTGPVREFGALMSATERKNAEEVVSSSLETTDVDGFRIGVCSASAQLSSMIGEVAREQGYDLTACFFFTRDKDTGAKSVVYSMRSSDRFDCGAFAKSMGGGGHARAAGFSAPCGQLKDMDPWGALMVLARRFISKA